MHSKRICTLGTVVVAGCIAFYTARTLARTGPAPQFTLRQIETVQDQTGAVVTSRQLLTISLSDGSLMESTNFNTPAGRLCESGSILFMDYRRVAYDSCTQLKSTFSADPHDRQMLRELSTCSKVFTGAALDSQGTAFGLDAERYVRDDAAQRWEFTVSSSLGCLIVAETHKWKNNNSLTGAVTKRETVELSTNVDEKCFHIADGFREVKPSEARIAMLAVLRHGNPDAQCFKNRNSQLDAVYSKGLTQRTLRAARH
jgi:hypothetical protein